MLSSIHNEKKYTIAIEGNIGSGKSTLLSYLAKSSLYDTIPEPVENWKNYQGHNILKKFYDNSHRWAFLFETVALMTLAKLHKKPTHAPIKILERSIHCTRYCFIENLHQNNVLDDVEYHILDDYFKMFTANESCKVDLIIYLQAEPKVCLERVQARDRPEEKSIDLDYITALHQRHEEWLIYGIHNDTCTPPVFTVNANQDGKRVYLDVNTHVADFVSN